MVAFLLSLVGVPRLAGVAGKLLLFGAAIDARYTWLAVVAILNSALSLAVHLRVVVPMYRSARHVAVVRPTLFAAWGVALASTLADGVAVEGVVGALGE